MNYPNLHECANDAEDDIDKAIAEDTSEWDFTGDVFEDSSESLHIKRGLESLDTSEVTNRGVSCSYFSSILGNCTRIRHQIAGQP